MFTKREEQVIDLIVRLRTNSQIAEELDISVQTVKSYKRRIGYKVSMAERTNPLKEVKPWHSPITGPFHPN